MKKRLILLLLIVSCSMFATTKKYPYNIEPEGLKLDQLVTSISTNTGLDSTTATDSQLPTYKAIVTNVESMIDSAFTDYSSATDTLTNKTIDADNNTITNIGDEEMKAGVNADKIADGSVSNTEFQYINSLSSNAQDQIDGKEDAITGAATTITSSDLTASRALISNALGKVEVSNITDTELNYLDNISSNIQTQLNTIAGYTATDIETDTTNFNNNLSATDTNIQTALETIDDISIINTDDTADTAAVVVYNGGLSAYKLLKGTGASDGDVVTYNSTSGEFEIRANPGAGGGEANTASNLGTGVGLFKQKNGIDLEFLSLDATDGYITVTDNTDTAVISANVGTDTNELVERSATGTIATDTISEITGDNGVTVDGVKLKDFMLNISETAEPDTAPANSLYLYAKDKAGTSALYFKDDAGTETEIGSGGGSTTAVGQYTLTANQTTNLTAGNEIAFNNEAYISSSPDFTFNSTNHQWTLKSGNEYIINYTLRAVFSGASAYLRTKMYNVTGAAQIGVVQGLNYPATITGNYNDAINTIVVKPATDIVVELQIDAVSNITQIETTFTSITIQEIQN